ncbi:hypothetical protein V5N11_009115 [Cardamine amara subsp. amara]|uniref:Uncharacterized protein n=1 Tax=Cardamine amara subsp. amara TaxID=228776 RepID=A0ABD1C7K5_CARAN
MGIENGIKPITLPPIGIMSGPIFPWVIWMIRTSRNKRIFENRVAQPEEMLTQAITVAREWQEAQDTPVSSQQNRSQPPRAQISQSKITCKSDAASARRHEKGGIWMDDLYKSKQNWAKDLRSLKM